MFANSPSFVGHLNHIQPGLLYKYCLCPRLCRVDYLKK